MTISVTERHGRIRLDVADDGIGFDLRRPAAANLTRRMRQHAQAANGLVTLTSTPGRGTRINLELPEPSITRPNQDSGSVGN